ncbi:Metallo-dependent phosphatase-like protein [Chytridium lagenaria]|nr:Metallo-dependent phosphatase-like protein [Chytridium lagenaria]
MLVLCLGDLHIPHRAVDLPPKFKKLLVPGKIHQILVTGNICTRETFDYLRTVSPDVQSVLGDFDDLSATPSSPPLTRTIDCGTLRIGLIHGHTIIPWGDRKALQAVARQMDVDVLVSGHTHRFEAFESEGRFFVNPGSATGSFSGSWRQNPVVPSFVLMDVQGPNVVLYVYKLINGDVKVEKLEFSKRVNQ